MRAAAPSATAYLIAASTLYLSADPLAGHLVPARSAELSERLLIGEGAAPWVLRALRRGLPRLLISTFERATIPGIQLHYALRKLYLEGEARAALADGFRQVVVIGAGYDTLALRLCGEFPTVHFIEADHPATQGRKVRALDGGANAPVPPNLRFLPVDLTRRRLARALLDFEFYRAYARTLFIAEGVLMYLAPGDVSALFENVIQCGAAAGRFAFTFMEPQPDGRINFRAPSRAVDAWLRLRREPFRWGIDHRALGPYLSARRLVVREMATEGTLRRLYLEPRGLAHLPLAAGEYICVAEFGGEGLK